MVFDLSVVLFVLLELALGLEGLCSHTSAGEDHVESRGKDVQQHRLEVHGRTSTCAPEGRGSAGTGVRGWTCEEGWRANVRPTYLDLLVGLSVVVVAEPCTARRMIGRGEGGVR
jgi:hypothetical protein